MMPPGRLARYISATSAAISPTLAPNAMRVGAGGKTRGRERGSICEQAVGRGRRRPARHRAVTAAASQIGNPCLPSFHLLLTLCTIILLRWNEGGVAYSRVGAHTEGGAARHEELGVLLFSCGCPGRPAPAIRATTPSFILMTAAWRQHRRCTSLHRDWQGGKEAGQFVESVRLTCNGQSTSGRRRP
jgi:hypothetical protein